MTREIHLHKGYRNPKLEKFPYGLSLALLRDRQGWETLDAEWSEHVDDMIFYRETIDIDSAVFMICKRLPLLIAVPFYLFFMHAYTKNAKH